MVKFPSVFNGLPQILVKGYPQFVSANDYREYPIGKDVVNQFLFCFSYIGESFVVVVVNSPLSKT